MKSWNDQPDVCADAVPLSRFSVGGGLSIEIRKAADVYYMTTGNLFGSQTVVSSDVDAVLRAVEIVADAAEARRISLPDGLTILENAEEDET